MCEKETNGENVLVCSMREGLIEVIINSKKGWGWQELKCMEKKMISKIWMET